MPEKFWLALLEGSIWSFLPLIIVYFVVVNQQYLPVTGFASRWEGTCAGWTELESLKHFFGNLFHWWSYCTIAFVFWRLHPPLKTVPYSSLTLFLVGLFVIGCGVGHLSMILTNFYPVYVLEGYWLLINGVISIIATIFVAFSLTKAFEIVHKDREEINRKLEELKYLKRNTNVVGHNKMDF